MSCNHSFGSPFVDNLGNDTQVLWIFGSKWYRPAIGRGLEGRLQWSGACADNRHCEIGSFRTSEACSSGRQRSR